MGGSAEPVGSCLELIFSIVILFIKKCFCLFHWKDGCSVLNTESVQVALLKLNMYTRKYFVISLQM